MAYVKDEYIEQAIADFDEIKKAIVEKGVDVPYGTDTKEYGKLIDNALIKGNQAEEDLNQTIKWYGELYLIDDPPTQFTENATITYMPPLDFSGKTSLANAFYKCTALEKIASINTSGVTSFKSCFVGCSKLTEIPLIDTSKGTDFTEMFMDCKGINSFPKLDLSSGITLDYMFARCNVTKVEMLFPNSPASYYRFAANSTIHEFIATNEKGMRPTNAYQMFSNCRALTTVSKLDMSDATNTTAMFTGCTSLKNLSVVENSIKTSMSIPSPVLSVESAKSILLGLYNYSGTDNAYKFTLTLHANAVALLEAEGNTAPNGMTWAEYVDSKRWNM